MHGEGDGRGGVGMSDVDDGALVGVSTLVDAHLSQRSPLSISQYVSLSGVTCVQMFVDGRGVGGKERGEQEGG